MKRPVSIWAKYDNSQNLPLTNTYSKIQEIYSYVTFLFLKKSEVKTKT